MAALLGKTLAVGHGGKHDPATAISTRGFQSGDGLKRLDSHFHTLEGLGKKRYMLSVFFPCSGQSENY